MPLSSTLTSISSYIIPSHTAFILHAIIINSHHMCKNTQCLESIFRRLSISLSEKKTFFRRDFLRDWEIELIIRRDCCHNMHKREHNGYIHNNRWLDMWSISQSLIVVVSNKCMYVSKRTRDWASKPEIEIHGYRSRIERATKRTRDRARERLRYLFVPPKSKSKCCLCE